MKQALEDYYRDVEQRAETFARKEEAGVRVDHLHAFNLGRRIQRIEHSRSSARIRIGWLLAGLVIGIICGRLYSSHVSPQLAQSALMMATSAVEGAEREALAWLGKSPR